MTALDGCIDVEVGVVCTARPGVVPSPGPVALCPPEDDCIDAVVHRTADRDWHTNHGTTAADWQAQRSVPAQLDLFAGASR